MVTFAPKTGAEFPKRQGVAGAGRTRQPNPFDTHIQTAYDDRDGASGGVLVFPATQLEAAFGEGEEGIAKAVAKMRASAEYLGYGLDTAEDENGDVVIRVRDKRIVIRKPKDDEGDAKK